MIFLNLGYQPLANRYKSLNSKKKKEIKYKLLVNFERLLECRAWEGFCVTYTHTRDVLQLSDDSKSFEMTFTMPWKPGVDILYNICSDDVLNLATSSGPFKRTVEASIRVELIASVEFLRNFVRNTNEASGRKRYPRLHRFLNTIQRLKTFTLQFMQSNHLLPLF